MESHPPPCARPKSSLSPSAAKSFAAELSGLLGWSQHFKDCHVQSPALAIFRSHRSGIKYRLPSSSKVGIEPKADIQAAGSVF
ncbi:hypothetical protein P9272_34380 [Mesorhizobium sp. WSM4976]|uniref:hypothetical protein n=1 Tax=Mesorhizobium sp. WSM4976 TaxID=3038549 RepID=UPI002416EAF2|nr:hypothetical protein [Mesorhizobium sp. WSM4976]MDG4898607.1 hypothetical protein [Mesorhizobium sp. WSM4976]